MPRRRPVTDMMTAAVERGFAFATDFARAGDCDELLELVRRLLATSDRDELWDIRYEMAQVMERIDR